jgi:glycosyltransferase involved in cell wall biosynthesis
MVHLPLVSVVAPIFNESEHIEEVLIDWIRKLDEFDAQFRYEIVLCNDSSSDSTLELLESFSLASGCLRIVSNQQNEGAGYSLRKAISHSRGDFILLVDSDGQFNIRDLLSHCHSVLSGQFDAVVGQRIKKDSWLLVLGSKLSSSILRYFISDSFMDFNCALKFVEGNLLRSLNLRARGLNYSAEVLTKLILSKANINQVPVQHLARKSGKSSSKLFKDGYARLLWTIQICLEHHLINKRILIDYGHEV